MLRAHTTPVLPNSSRSGIAGPRRGGRPVAPLQLAPPGLLARLHPDTLISACRDLGANPHDSKTEEHERWATTYSKLRRWVHMLGFGGHFTTRSRRYGPTRKALKAIRRDYRRSQQILGTSGHRTANHLDDSDTTLVIGDLTYAGIGWLTTGDAELAATAAAKAREYATTRKHERDAA